jgi:predicted amidohydrolase
MVAIGLAQVCHPADGDVLGLVRRVAVDTVERGVDMLVFPESLMTRYERKRQDFLAAAEPLDGPFSRGVDAIAAEFGLWMVYTVNELNPDGRPFNTAVLVDASGTKRGAYRKVHLFDTDFTQESKRMAAGDQLFEPVETPFGTIGLAICYDLRFPEVARFAATRGCDLMLYPSAWVDGSQKVTQWRTLLAARAIENAFFVAGLSRPDKGYIGHSCVFDPSGELLAEAGEGECLLVAELDSDRIAEVRSRMPVLAHRRPELYG